MPYRFATDRTFETSMKTKLVIVEGVPGSGKTTTAQFIYEWARHHGAAPLLYQEGNLDHPADFESCSCLNEDEYTQLVGRYASCGDMLAQNLIVKPSGHFLNYRKLKREYGDGMPDELFNELAQYDVYNLPPQKYLSLATERWQEFLAQAVGGENTYIFECCFLQNPLTILLGRHNSAVEVAQTHIMKIAESLKVLQPGLVYLCSSNLRQTLEHAAQTRPQEWVDFVIHYLTQQGYGQARGYQGYDGVIKFYEMRQELELELLPRLGWRQLVIDTRAGEWKDYHRQIEGFMGADSAVAPAAC
jgi:hypothetical protein